MASCGILIKKTVLMPVQIYLMLDTILDILKKEESIDEGKILESIKADISQQELPEVDDDELYVEKKRVAMAGVHKVLRYIVEKRLSTKLETGKRAGERE